MIATGQRPSTCVVSPRVLHARPTGHTAREPGLHNLPQPLTGFVGRQREIAEARRLLHAHRLLTLTGTGGVGKTRLGHEIAASMVEVFEDGVWLVELVAVADPSLVLHTVASAVGVREQPNRPLTGLLLDALRPRTMLLVLDNCEHLTEACAKLADVLLGACPKLKILATSRQPLGIGGETSLRVPSLSLSSGLDGPPLPGSGGRCAQASVGDPPATSGRCEPPAMSEAAQLFAVRAQAVAPAFVLTDCNIPTVERICSRLDGIPLAIELAAARVSVLSLDQIARRLGDRLRLLTSGSPSALPRHRTLRSLIDWSHDQLDPGERTLFRRLAVFGGSCTLEAAEAICAGDGLASDEILDLLSGLVTKSLVQAGGQDDEARYAFLETLREYAAEKLREAGEETIVRERHRDWYLALAEQAEPELLGPQRAAWLDCLDRDRENVRTVTRRAIAEGDSETLIRLGAALRRTLGPTTTSDTVEAGRQSSLDQAVRETLTWLAEPERDGDCRAGPVLAAPSASTDAPDGPMGGRPVLGAGGLSPRELEVAALVARGLTNRRIADELVIAEGTAASHVKHILAKLVLDSRVQIAAWVIEHGLHQSARSEGYRRR